jgi:hypothetical protein
LTRIVSPTMANQSPADVADVTFPATATCKVATFRALGHFVDISLYSVLGSIMIIGLVGVK